MKFYHTFSPFCSCISKSPLPLLIGSVPMYEVGYGYRICLNHLYIHIHRNFSTNIILVILRSIHGEYCINLWQNPEY